MKILYPDTIQARKSYFYFKIYLYKNRITLADEFQKLHNLISFHTSLFLSASDIFQEGGVFYSILAILQVTSLLYIIYHAFSLSSFHALPSAQFLQQLCCSSFRSITLHPRWPPRTVSHWLRELGNVINHCPKQSKRKWKNTQIRFGQFLYW